MPALPLLSYSLIAFLLVITPGADVLLVVGSALRGGARTGIMTGIGIATGCLIWTLLVALGLVALLKASPAAYNVLTLLGVLYMLYIGVGEIRAGLVQSSALHAVAAGVKRSDGAAMGKGIAVNLMNPKVGIFYLTFLPQFLPNGQMTVGNVLLLGGIHAGLGVLWLSFCALAVDRSQALLNNQRVNRGLMIAAGTLIIAFAVLVLWFRFA